jgi:hypothetical protein
MYCDGCGNQLTTGAQFCAKCGKAIVGAGRRQLRRRGKAWGKPLVFREPTGGLLELMACQRVWRRGPMGGFSGICGRWRRCGRLPGFCG